MEASEVLTEREMEQVILAVVKHRPATHEELTAAVDWAAKARLEATMLQLVLEGRMYLRMDGDEVTFIAPVAAIQGVYS